MSADGVDQARPPAGPIPGRPGPRPARSAPAPGPTGDVPAPPVLNGELDARLAAVEALPLAERAAAYSELHDSLRDHLEGGDVPRSKAE
ncbi:hypothetical protein [Cryobacterium sp. PAMC25264]|uniref:hypothetical protein n=1 Tax=Cryobacterium sp. PAMC25264 TaxID=2861288 RepID=UPI001C6255F1|nr:hypothetical protein [Cryobacterium sp. PAMC25264]QYF75618.1 hypothetical protein KY500_03800 [Cryobacterium sp. PAMC25264]